MTHHLETGPISSSQFDDELVNLAGFNHENILKVIEAGFHTIDALRIPFVVTEYVEGPTLRDVLESNTLQGLVKNDDTYVADLILQLCRGVSHLHSRQFFHCDIAPKNIFIKGAYPQLQLVIGDLGVGRMRPLDTQRPFFIVGTRDYCPENVKEVMHTLVSPSRFNELQPRWDVFAVAKTCLSLLNAVPSSTSRRPWLSAMKSKLADVMSGVATPSAQELERALEWLRPVQHTMAGVLELADSFPSHSRLLVPIEQVDTSHRIRQIANHPAMVRLNRVPQLVMATAVFPSATHTRYEHSLGTYQAARRYLLALLDDDNFLKDFSPRDIELCLVCSLLVSITRFPFSTIIHEIRTYDSSLFRKFSRRALLDDLLTSKRFRDRNHLTLAGVIEKHFPLVNVSDVQKLVGGGPKALQAVAERFIHFVLNSSIDARVMDYLRRDSLHLGISTGHEFSIGDLLPHVEFDNGRLTLRTSGLSVVEQIISLRYWLFNRIYWNRQNRSLIAMVRYVLLTLERRCGKRLEREMRSCVLSASETEVLERLLKIGREVGDADVAGVCCLLREARPRRFDEIYQCNRSEDDAVSRMICDKIRGFSLREFEALHVEMNRVVGELLGNNRMCVLIDMPVERGALKLGDDLNVKTPSGAILPLDRLSGIVRGVQQSFVEQLERVRIFMHPEVFDSLSESRKSIVRQRIRATLQAVV